MGEIAALKIGLYQPQDRARWEEYLKGASTATLYHDLGWKEVVEKSFGQKAYYWYAEDRSGQIRGIFPAIHLKSFLFGSFMVSLPYFNYGGICAEDDFVATALLKEATEWAAEEKISHIELRQEAPLNIGLPFKTAKVSMRLPLPSNSDELFKTFDAKLRSQIRRPTKDGMIAKIGRIEELDSFYSVFSENMRDLGTPVYPTFFFKNILEAFPDTSWICTVYQNTLPVASGFLIGFRETLEIPWASSLRAYNRSGPNMLLYWTALSWACDRGYRVFDFGRSTPGEGTYKFKEQWGAKAVPLYWYYWMKNEGKLPELNPKNPKYAAAIQLWKKLPVGLTRMIGPAIVKNLP